MVLGQRLPEPTGGTVRERETLETRPNVIADDGTEYEVVWYPHRDAASLLDDSEIETRHEDHTQSRGEVQIKRRDPNERDGWSWLG